MEGLFTMFDAYGLTMAEGVPYSSTCSKSAHYNAFFAGESKENSEKSVIYMGAQIKKMAHPTSASEPEKSL